MRCVVLCVLFAAAPALAQETCEPDTVRFGLDRATTNRGVSFLPGEAAGQLYPEPPGPVILTGIEANVYGVSSACNPWPPADCSGADSDIFQIDAAVYYVDAQGMPTGTPVASARQSVDCLCDASFGNTARTFDISPPVTLTQSYAVVIENNNTNNRMLRVVINDPDTGDGQRENLGRWREGGGAWRGGLETNCGYGTTCDADVYVHPVVQLQLDASFEVVSESGDTCATAAERVEFVDRGDAGAAASHVYNERVRDTGDTLNANIVSSWDFGDGGTSAGMAAQHSYSSTGFYTVTRTLTSVGYDSTCEVSASAVVGKLVQQFFDCDHDEFTGSSSGLYCGEPQFTGDECAGGMPPAYGSEDQGDCRDDIPEVNPDASEVCNGIDDDCDGSVDNGLPDLPANNAEGACADNVQECFEGAYRDAPNNYLPQGDVCDGVDNDCDSSTPDGHVEPSIGEPCDGDDADTCKSGVIACIDGSLQCTDDPGDDDCDVEPDTDSDTDSDTTPGATQARCGCASAPGPGGALGLGLVLMGLARRRRR